MFNISAKLLRQIEERVLAETTGKPEACIRVAVEEVLKNLDKPLIALQFVARAYPDIDAGPVCQDAFADFCANVAEPIKQEKETECQNTK